MESEAECKRCSEYLEKVEAACDAERRRELLSDNSEERKNRVAKGKAMCDAAEIERMSENYEEQEMGKEAEECDPIAEKLKDPLAFKYNSYKQFWDDLYTKFHGRFEDNTNIPCMRFTYKPLPYDATTFRTLDILSVKVAEISEGLQWPLDVFGVVALRDSVDHNRNVIFNRERGSCLTITDQDPYLVLTGPMRAAILCDPVTLEVSLHVRGATKSEDKELSLLATSFWDGTKPRASYFTTESYTSRLSTLEFGLGVIVRSVEATTSVKVSSGSWPNGYCGRFVAFTDSLNKNILLLDSGSKEVPLTGHEVNLSRHVVSVELNGKLRISVHAWHDSVPLLGEVDFQPKKFGTSSKKLCIEGFCPLEVIMAWSLFSLLPASKV